MHKSCLSDLRSNGYPYLKESLTVIRHSVVTREGAVVATLIWLPRRKEEKDRTDGQASDGGSSWDGDGRAANNKTGGDSRVPVRRTGTRVGPDCQTVTDKKHTEHYWWASEAGYLGTTVPVLHGRRTGARNRKGRAAKGRDGTGQSREIVRGWSVHWFGPVPPLEDCTGPVPVHVLGACQIGKLLLYYY